MENIQVKLVVIIKEHVQLDKRISKDRPKISKAARTQQITVTP